MEKTALILGASGRFGRNAADALVTAGWTVRRFNRASDAMEIAAKGVQLIVAASNPEYADWADQVPGLHARIRKVALENDATVLIPGNVYVFGPDAPRGWSDTTPHLATNPLGEIRKQMEEAYRRDGVKTILLRAGDFIDTQASGNWFDMIMIKRLSQGRLSYPGRLDADHAWAYLPDLAKAAAMLADKRDTLDRFCDVSFPGYTLTGKELGAALSAARKAPIKVKPMAWWPLRLARPFVPMMKHLFEMRYLWNLPHHLEGARFQQLLPGFTPTPLTEALRAATAHVD